MPKSPRQKLKLIVLRDILERETDAAHPITMSALIARLAEEGIEAERKSLYDDIALLEDYGLDVMRVRLGRQTGYYVGSRLFEMPELKLLVDAVQSSRFITKRKSETLIAKLSTLAGEHEARGLSRQVHTTNRIKAENETVYYTVDELHNAISENRQVSFCYFSWNMQKEKQLRHNGAVYTVSPWALIWDDEYYYLVAYNSVQGTLRHYRVDKMVKVKVLDLPREGADLFAAEDTATYSQRMFGMFSGAEELVTLRCDRSLVDVILDRFGTGVTIMKCDAQTFEVTVHVAVSPNFLAWVIGFGNRMRVVMPQTAADAVATLAKESLHQM